MNLLSVILDLAKAGLQITFYEDKNSPHTKFRIRLSHLWLNTRCECEFEILPSTPSEVKEKIVVDWIGHLIKKYFPSFIKHIHV